MQCYTEEQWWQLSDGLLDAGQADAMTAHRRACPRCAALWGEIRRFEGGLCALAPEGERCDRIAARAVGTHLRRRVLRRIARVTAAEAGSAAAILLVAVLVPPKAKDERPLAGTTPGAPRAADDVAATSAPAPPAGAGARETPEEMRFPWGTVSEVTAPAAFTIVRAAGDVFCARLARGSARFEVDPAAGTAVAIETPDAVIEVVGTVFSVAVRDEGRIRTEVTVERGTVRIVHGGEVLIVAAGGSFPPRVREAPPAPPPGGGAPSIDVPSSRGRHDDPAGAAVDMPSSMRVEY